MIAFLFSTSTSPAVHRDARMGNCYVPSIFSLLVKNTKLLRICFTCLPHQWMPFGPWTWTEANLISQVSVLIVNEKSTLPPYDNTRFLRFLAESLFFTMEVVVWITGFQHQTVCIFQFQLSSIFTYYFLRLISRQCLLKMRHIPNTEW